MLKKKTNLHFIILVGIVIIAIILLSSTQIYAGYGWGWGGQRSSYNGVANTTSINLYNSDNNNITVNNQNVINNDLYNIYGVGYGWGHGWGWGANRQASLYSGVANMTSINLYNSDYNNIIVNNQSIIDNNTYNNFYPASWYSGCNVAPDFLYEYTPSHYNFSDNNFYTYVPSYNINSFCPNLDGLNY